MIKTNDIENKVKDSGAAFAAEVKEASSVAKSKAEEITKSLLDKTSSLQNNLLEHVKENPYKALAIALISGWFIAKL